jgi:uncharacterized protein YcbK (DUF882 family)
MESIGEDLLLKNADAAEQLHSDRRGFLKSGLVVTAALGFWTPDLAQAAMPSAGRELRFYNQHTGEKFIGEYWYNGRYLPDAFGEIKSVMRDHRTGEKFPIDPRLMDILYVLQRRLGNDTPFEVLSGYRSPSTNAKLRRLSRGVAEGSLHMTGQAVDIRQKGTDLRSLRSKAVSLKSGGVGFYRSSNFVHIDTGRIRSW